MAEIVNLNRARKSKARADKEVLAAENRVRFGQTKADKAKAATEKSITEKRIDGHKRERP